MSVGELEAMVEPEAAAVLEHVAGGSMSTCSVAYTKDARYGIHDHLFKLLTLALRFIFTGCGAFIRMVSVATGQTVRTLRGHSSLVTCCILHPSNPLQLLSCSHDGEVRVWDFTTSKCLARVTLGKPLVKVLVNPITLTTYVVSRETDDGKTSWDKLYPIMLGGSTSDNGESATSVWTLTLIPGIGRALLTVRNASRWAMDPKVCTILSVQVANMVMQGSFVAIAAKKKLRVYSFKTKKTQKHRSPAQLTALACHPEQPYIATGDRSGMIKLWYCLGEHVDNPTVTTLHWHSHSVSDVVFNVDGSYLLSGETMPTSST